MMKDFFKKAFKKAVERKVLKTRNIQVSLKSMAQYISKENEDGSFDIVCRMENATYTGIRFSEKLEASALPYPQMRQKLEDLEIGLRDQFMIYKRDVASQFAPFDVKRSIDEFNSVRLPDDHYTHFSLDNKSPAHEKSLIQTFLRR